MPAWIKDRIFGDHDPAQAQPEPSALELAEANSDLAEMNRKIRDQEGRDVKHWKDVI